MFWYYHSQRAGGSNPTSPAPSIVSIGPMVCTCTVCHLIHCGSIVVHVNPLTTCSCIVVSTHMLTDTHTHTRTHTHTHTHTHRLLSLLPTGLEHRMEGLAVISLDCQCWTSLAVQALILLTSCSTYLTRLCTNKNHV